MTQNIFQFGTAFKDHPGALVEKIYLTASGGSFGICRQKTNKLSLKRILKHPSWSMGEKITIDSSTLMNKVFEVIETKKIFNVNYNKINIIIHKDLRSCSIKIF